MNVQHMQHDERFNNLILVSGILQVYPYFRYCKV